MNNMSILVVDDEIDFRSTLIKRMRKRNFKATGVSSGEEALAHLASETADVVILDFKMPGICGLETLKLIKSRYPSIEVILLTGHASAETAIKGMEAGAFDYLMKPMDIDELLYKAIDAYHHKRTLENKHRLRC